MNGLTGMEKFSHLEDKIYLTIQFAKKMREDKLKIETELAELKERSAALAFENERLERRVQMSPSEDETSQLTEENAWLKERVQTLLTERDAIQLKVEAMLEAMTIIDADVAEAVGR